VQTYPGSAKTGKQVQASASLIFDVLQEFEPGSLLLEQARREVLERHYEQGRLGRAFARLRGGLRMVRTRRPTPLSFPLLIERLAGRLSSESILERIERMQKAWATGWTAAESKSGSGAAREADAGPTRAGRRSPWRRPPARPGLS
jgi:Lhr-like helicase